MTLGRLTDLIEACGASLRTLRVPGADVSTLEIRREDRRPGGGAVTAASKDGDDGTDGRTLLESVPSTPVFMTDLVLSAVISPSTALSSFEAANVVTCSSSGMEAKLVIDDRTL